MYIFFNISNNELMVDGCWLGNGSSEPNNRMSINHRQ